VDIFLIIVVFLAGLFYFLWSADVSLQRSDDGMCPRCGVGLEGQETEIVRDGKRGEIEWVMCIPCARKSKKGPLWLWLFAAISAVIVAAIFLISE
jgi:hypothetical protein